MRNTECTIYITTRHGRAWKYRRDKDGWTQTGPTGKVRRMTAEQLLSHILPPLAAGKGSHLTVRVKANTPTRKDKFKTPNSKLQGPEGAESTKLQITNHKTRTERGKFPLQSAVEFGSFGFVWDL